ncbi:MAG: 50S ribosomal protein L6 [Candidatus Cloacimonetes bacterium]|nr:50S ribosomal protein L6 [Candidatus Cloacimonadota bacterium]
MSRIGKTPVILPTGVNVNIADNKVVVKGKLGELNYTLPTGISISQNENLLILEREDDTRTQKAFHGLSRALVNNMVIGVSTGYEKVLQVIGTGYSAEKVGKWLRLNLGFSHDILLEVPAELSAEATTIPRREQGKLGVQAVIRIKGISKEDVGKFSAEIRKCRPPENYKGKGIRYEGEYVQIKAGKAGAK